MIAWEPSLAPRDLRLAVNKTSELALHRNIEGSIRVGENTWIGFQTSEPIAGWVLLVGTFVRVGFVALLVLGSAALIVRTLSAPLQRLSEKSQLIGTSSRVDFDEGKGPLELRQVSHALNEMQDRIDGLIAQRTQALAAVGHDLRTPLARLRLRFSAIQDREERAAAEDDIGQMTRMLQELLDYFDTGTSTQIFEPVDLASLCQTLAEKFADLHADVRFEGPGRMTVAASYDGLVRGIENLVDNAVKYGGGAIIRLAERSGNVEVWVDDEGPGIPARDLDRAVLPFERLEWARTTKHAGMGLGLSIAQHAAEAHVGRLELINRPSGGLRVALTFPSTPARERLD